MKNSTDETIFLKEIGKLNNKIHRRVEDYNSGEEFSGIQGLALHFIYINSDRDIFQKDIEKEFGLRAPTTTQLLNKLEKTGMILREYYDKDARKKKIIVTKKGMEYADKVQEYIDYFEEELKYNISLEDQDKFLEILDKMIKNLS